MNNDFKCLVEKLPILMKNLLLSYSRTYNDLGLLPDKGIYVFFENNEPIYVGRTNRMRGRLKEHGGISSGHNKAPLAFNMAKKAALQQGFNINMKRAELEKNPLFSVLFMEAKERVRGMSVKVVPIEEPVLQTLFEVYASMELGTSEFNSFDNH